MNSDSVKPIPATPPIPSTIRHVTPSGRRAPRTRVAIHVDPMKPSGLPIARPAMMPRLSGACSASAIASGDKWMRTLDSANSGSTT